MRTLTAQESKLYDVGRFATWTRVSVLDASFTWRDLTDVVDKDWLVSVEWDGHIDQPVAQCSVTLKRDSHLDSLALVASSRPNLLTGGYSQLVQVGREFLVETAITPERVRPAAGDWREVFRGDIQAVSYGPDPMSFTGRDLAGRLQDVFIEEERDYGSTMGVPIEDVIQQLINDNHAAPWAANNGYSDGGPTVSPDRVLPSPGNETGFWYRCESAGTSDSFEPAWPTTLGATVSDGGTNWSCAGTCPILYVPASPGFVLLPFRQRQEALLNAIRNLALSNLGWDVRYRWRESEGTFRLTLSVPDRATTTAVHTFGPSQYRDVQQLDVSALDVRNAVSGVYSDPADLDVRGTPKRKTIRLENPASMAKYTKGLPRWMQTSEASTSQIDTAGEMTDLLEAQLSDLSEPTADQSVTLPYWYPGELWDLYAFSPNGVHYDSEQKFAVVSLRHSLTRDSAETTILTRGKPAVAVEGWLRREARPGNAAPATLVGPAAPTDVEVLPVVGGFEVSFAPPTVGKWEEFEVHASTSSGFTPDDTTVQAVGKATTIPISTLTPGTDYYIQVVPRDAKGNRGTASAEESLAAGYTTPRAMQPRVRFGAIPMNADFEGWVSGSGAPPEAWSIDLGPAWGVSFTRSSDALSGLYAVKLLETANLAVQIKSDPFPAHVNAIHRAWAWVRWSTTDTVDATVSVQWFDEADVAISQTSVTFPADDTDWHRVEFFTSPPADTHYGVFKFGKSDGSTSYALLDSAGIERLDDSEAITPSFNTGWGDFGSGFESARLERAANGRVYPVGSIARSSGSASLVWTAPAGWRPGATRRVMLDGTASLEIRANGEMHVLNGSNSTQYSIEQMSPYLVVG